MLREMPIEKCIEFSEISLKFHRELKDQGFTRPRVLILVPFRNTAWEVVNMILEYSPKSHQVFQKYSRYVTASWTLQIKKGLKKSLL